MQARVDPCNPNRKTAMLAIRAALTFALALAAAAPAYADPTDDLSMAARGGAASGVRAAVSAGADPSVRDDDGKTPFDYAKDNAALRGTAVYWRLNEGRFK